MDPSVALSQLEHLLQVAADVLHQIATLRPKDQAALELLSGRIDDIAEEIERILAGGPLS